MKEELTGLYARNSALYAENEILKSRLSAYELPTMAQASRVTAWTGEPVTDASAATTEELRRKWIEKNETAKLHSPATEELRQKWLKNNREKMPWEG